MDVRTFLQERVFNTLHTTTWCILRHVIDEKGLFSPPLPSNRGLVVAVCKLATTCPNTSMVSGECVGYTPPPPSAAQLSAAGEEGEEGEGTPAPRRAANAYIEEGASIRGRRADGLRGATRTTVRNIHTSSILPIHIIHNMYSRE